MSACVSGKRRHETPDAAQIACDDLRRNDCAKRRKLLRVYRCNACRGWHVGHTKRRFVKARKAVAA